MKSVNNRSCAFAYLQARAAFVLGFALATQGWQIYAVIALGLLGGTANAAIQSIVSGAADAHTQGQTMGAVSSLNSLMAVVAPVVGLELLRQVSHRPAGDPLIGLPLFVSAALMLMAALIALRFFRHHPAPSTP